MLTSAPVIKGNIALKKLNLTCLKSSVVLYLVSR